MLRLDGDTLAKAGEFLMDSEDVKDEPDVVALGVQKTAEDAEDVALALRSNS